MPQKTFINKLTPAEAWRQYVTDDVILFLSNFRDDGIADIREACQLYASEIPSIFEQLFTQNQITHIANLLEQHVNNYVHKMGGIDKLTLYTDEEMDAIWNDETVGTLEVINIFAKKEEKKNSWKKKVAKKKNSSKRLT
ncbi:MAG: hypothetical protein NUK65_11685 [Firmicutes bacterium]|nr:hypothetical protein [Bacillota bacterium]